MAIEKSSLGYMFQSEKITEFLEASLVPVYADSVVTTTDNSSGYSTITISSKGSVLCTLGQTATNRMTVTGYYNDSVFKSQYISHSGTGLEVNGYGTCYGITTQNSVVLSFGAGSASVSNENSWCVVFTLDSSGNTAVVFPSASGTPSTTIASSTSNFYVITHDDGRTIAPTALGFVGVSGYGCTVMAPIPVPSSDGVARCTPNVFFVPCRQYSEFGKSVIGDDTYLNLVGWMAKDE